MTSQVRASVGLALLFTVTVGAHSRDESSPNCTTDCTTAERTVADGRRLWQAEKAEVEDFPYVAAVTYGGEVWCSAAIVKPNFLLTTANCFWLIRNPEQKMFVVYGVSRADEHTLQHRIEKVVIHPKWKPPPHTPDYDIAVICVPEYIHFTAIVHDVELPPPGHKPHLNLLFVTGFGWNDMQDFDPRVRSLSRQLRSYTTTMSRHNACADKLATMDLPLSKRFLCLRAAPQRAPCVRDTGAPAVFDGRLWGLASWSFRAACGNEEWPVVFTKVADEAIMDFIEFTIDMQMNAWKLAKKAPPFYV